MVWTEDENYDEDEDSYEFVPKCWLMSWLADPSSVGPLETNHLLCVHENLDIDRSSQVNHCESTTKSAYFASHFPLFCPLYFFFRLSFFLLALLSPLILAFFSSLSLFSLLFASFSSLSLFSSFSSLSFSSFPLFLSFLPLR